MVVFFFFFISTEKKKEKKERKHGPSTCPFFPTCTEKKKENNLKSFLNSSTGPGEHGMELDHERERWGVLTDLNRTRSETLGMRDSLGEDDRAMLQRTKYFSNMRATRASSAVE